MQILQWAPIVFYLFWRCLELLLQQKEWPPLCICSFWVVHKYLVQFFLWTRPFPVWIMPGALLQKIRYFWNLLEIADHLASYELSFLLFVFQHFPPIIRTNPVTNLVNICYGIALKKSICNMLGQNKQTAMNVNNCRKFKINNCHKY